MASWDLSVTVEDLGPDAPPVTLSVASDLHVGGVILKLVEKTRGSLCVCQSVLVSRFISGSVHRLKIASSFAWTRKNSHIGNTIRGFLDLLYASVNSLINSSVRPEHDFNYFSLIKGAFILFHTQQ